MGQSEIIQRLTVVEELLAKGTPQHRVVELAQKQWGSSKATAYRYCATVRERWAKEREQSRPSDVEATLARLVRLSHKLETKEAWGPLMTCEKLMADVRGVRAPERHEHKVAAVVAQVGTAAVDLLDDTSDGFLNELEALMRKKLASGNLQVIGDASVQAVIS